MLKFFERYNLKNKVIAVGVSGGADSLALVLRLKELGINVVALSVDHGLRPSSNKEAQYVAELMAKFGIEHHILEWKGDKPQTGIEAAARKARYELLCSWCKVNDVQYLAVGHHRRDQAETFLLRLQRGSGLSGLCGMADITVQNGINIIRPQLDDDPEELRNYLLEKNIKWVEDESNQSDDFLRVKIRKFLPELEDKIAISEKRLADTAKVLRLTREYLDFEVAKVLKNQVRKWSDVVYSLSFNNLETWHSEISYRVLAEILREVGKKDYAPEADEIIRLISALKKDDFKGCTLNGCEIFIAQKRLWIIPEVGAKQLLSKEKWEECLQFMPQYAKASLPYKVRRALYNEILKENKNGQEK
ncbi:MAG: tRNA lysidine(34) synthetase TilS [Alphaproteobacteria bacterium]|nr:tRNA lysidine(34) synthetase TilS [Alphaproteobacteria bacterium]